ncbi:MAG: S8 family serine peptidase [Salinibacterium sp.]|nr:S8 family serine peptidase [Salinibacterium sp.]
MPRLRNGGDGLMRRTRGFVAGVLVVASVALMAAPAHADTVRDSEYWLDSYGIRAAWNTTKGAGVTIAVIDTGVDASVPELQGAVISGTDFSGLGSPDGQTPVGPPDESGHGTMVASLAAGRGSGGDNGVIGVAPAATILPISIGFGEGSTTSDDQIAAAVRYATDAGADVINMSLTRNTLEWPTSWDDAFLYAMEHDVVIVAAAGNRGSGTTQVGAPATMPGVLTVAGVDANGQASFDASSQGITIGVAAPSEGLVGATPGGGHVIWNGTSGATPLVAGIVALVRAAHPGLDAANVIQRIVATARDAGTPGTDPIYGFGLVDAAAAVNSATVPAVTENPMGSLAEWIKLYRRAASTPTPGPTRTATPEPPPITAAPVNPLGTVLPTVNLLRNVGIPFGLLLLVGVAAGLLITRVVRAFRGPRETG